MNIAQIHRKNDEISKVLLAILVDLHREIVDANTASCCTFNVDADDCEDVAAAEEVANYMRNVLGHYIASALDPVESTKSAAVVAKLPGSRSRFLRLAVEVANAIRDTL